MSKPIQDQQNTDDMEPFQIDKKDLTCQICNQIFDQPITLNCGHTFCKICVYHSIIQLNNPLNKLNKNKQNNQTNILVQQLSSQKSAYQQMKPQFQNKQLKQKQSPLLPLCHTCSEIIWKPLSVYTPNIVLSALISKHGFQREQQTSHLHKQKLISQHQNFQSDNPFHILLKCKKPNYLPLPSCFSQITFYTNSPQAVLQRSSESYVILKYFQKGEKITFKNGKTIDISENYDGIAVKCLKYEEINQYKGIYKGKFLGLNFVKIIHQIQINKKMRKNSNDSSKLQIQQHSNNQYDLTLCTSQIVHPKNLLRLQNFQFFFQFYDMLNNPHYMRQINHLIDRDVFQFRNNCQMMLYCAIRVLRLPEVLEQQIINTFDDQKRIQMIDDWLVSKADSIVEEVMRVSTPGKFNSGILFIIIALLIGLHILR